MPEELSQNLNAQYGKGFSIANLRLFRQFYQTYPERMDGCTGVKNSIDNLSSSLKWYGEESESAIPPSEEFATRRVANAIHYPVGSGFVTGFHPQHPP